MPCFERMKQLVKRPVLVDLRNVYKPAEMAAAGIEYHSIGRPHVPVAARG